MGEKQSEEGGFCVARLRLPGEACGNEFPQDAEEESCSLYVLWVN